MPTSLTANQERPIALACVWMAVVAAINFLQGFCLIVTTINLNDSLPKHGPELDLLFGTGIGCWAIGMLMLGCRQKLRQDKMIGAAGALPVAALNIGPAIVLIRQSTTDVEPSLLQMGLLILLALAILILLVFAMQSIRALPRLRTLAITSYPEAPPQQHAGPTPPRPRATTMRRRNVGRSRFVPPGSTPPPPESLQ